VKEVTSRLFRSSIAQNGKVRAEDPRHKTVTPLTRRMLQCASVLIRREAKRHPALVLIHDLGGSTGHHRFSHYLTMIVLLVRPLGRSALAKQPQPHSDICRGIKPQPFILSYYVEFETFFLMYYVLRYEICLRLLFQMNSMMIQTPRMKDWTIILLVLPQAVLIHLIWKMTVQQVLLIVPLIL
jgi:hypothetical protein